MIDMPTKNLSELKVAFIHDWLVGYRGGERMLEVMLEAFPQAEIFTLFYNQAKVSPRIEAHTIHASFLNKIPGKTKIYREMLPLFPMAIESFDLSKFDLVISSSHCVAKGVIPSPHALHICYCYTPMRYAWDKASDYFSGWKKVLVQPFLHYLRMWDVNSASRVSHFIAISNWVKSRIKNYYGREASVITPYVDLDFFKPIHGEQGDYFLTVSAFAPNKRLDLAIKACEKMGKKLIIVGEGQEKAQLEQLAGLNTKFVGKISFEELADLYSGCKALLFTGEDDFGISPLEAMASGRPVIAYARGGALETVIENKTGVFFREPSVESLVDAIERFEKLSFSVDVCRKQAERFSKNKFQTEFLATVTKLWEEHASKNAQSVILDVEQSAPATFSAEK